MIKYGNWNRDNFVLLAFGRRSRYPVIHVFSMAFIELWRGVPLLKHVAAGPGQRICRTGLAISIDGRPVVRARSHDSHGRPLPVWQGCRKLAQDQVQLLNPAVPDSLDGRYFSALPASVLLGRAAPILTRDAPNAPLIWRGIGS